MFILPRKDHFTIRKPIIELSGLGLILSVITIILLAIQQTNQIPSDLSQTLGAGPLPLSFAPNHGQAHEGVLYQAQSFGGSLQFYSHQLKWSLPVQWQGQTSVSAPLQLRFLGTQEAPQVTAGKELPGIVNYLIGDNPANWLSNIPTYEEIVYKGLYPGIDLYYSGEQAVGGQWSLKGTYIVAPGADPNQIHWQYQGVSSIELDQATGDLLISMSSDKDHTLVEGAPKSWRWCKLFSVISTTQKG
jgi:hypothetical protein